MPIRDKLRRLLNADKASPKSNPPPPVRPKPAQPAASEPSPPAAAGTHTLALYKYDACPFCRRVMRTIDQLGIEGQIEMRDTRREPRWRADLIEKTGRTQVPCLFIDGEPMFESADISRWLTEQYG